MIAPQIYAGFGTSSTDTTMSRINGGDQTILSGPNWLPTLTGNLGELGENGDGTLKRENGHTWYCLDLLGKYHRKSILKQFHALTFYFRDTTKGDGAIIASMLPESFTYSIGGKYGTPFKLSADTLVSALAQEVSNGNLSFNFAVDTAQIWNSPKPMELIFRIPIIDDSATGSHINYQEAIDLFGEAILPEMGADGSYESVPGPSLVTALEYKASHGKHTRASTYFKRKRDLSSRKIQESINGIQKHWDRISVQVGGLLLLDWCIIKDLKVTFPNTKAMVLHNFKGYKKGFDYRAHLQPIQAEIEVTVATVMGVTRATFKDMLYQTKSEKDEQTLDDEINATKSAEDSKKQLDAVSEDWQTNKKELI